MVLLRTRVNTGSAAPIVRVGTLTFPCTKADCPSCSFYQVVEGARGSSRTIVGVWSRLMVLWWSGSGSVGEQVD